MFKLIARGGRRSLTRKKLLPMVLGRTPFQHSHVPFIVCWSQKAGCTAILKWFLYHANLLDEALAYRDPNRKLQIHNYERRVFKARRGYKNELVDQVIAGKPVIQFLRCPYERVFSSYVQLNNSRFLRLEKTGQSTPGMLLRLKILESLHGKTMKVGYPLTFQEYIAWIVEQELETLDPHHAPQCGLLDDAIPIDYYALEDFDRSVSLLEKTFSLQDSSMTRDLFSSNHHRKKEAIASDDALKFLHEPIPLRQLRNMELPKITKEILETTEYDPIIRKLFAKDIARHKSIK
jgi:hypothetical protein